MESTSVVSLFSDLVRCETRLYHHLDGELTRRHGLVTSQYEFLRHVRDHPATRVADLAAEFAVGVGATSKGVDRLERRGWLTRRPNPHDRRSTVLALTGDGLALVRDAEATVRERLGTVFGAVFEAVPPGDVEAAGRVLAALRAALERDGLGTPAG